MLISFSPNFDKQFEQRLTRLQQIKVLDALVLFQSQQFYKDFRNHELKGEWLGHRSISVEGDLRLHFRLLDTDTAYFVALGTHKQLYS